MVRPTHLHPGAGVTFPPLEVAAIALGAISDTANTVVKSFIMSKNLLVLIVDGQAIGLSLGDPIAFLTQNIRFSPRQN